MIKTFKQTLLLITAMMASAVVTSCNNVEDDMMEAQQDATQVISRNVGTKTPKLTVYIETNDVNPRNAGEYYFTGTNPKEEVIDHVILFASNIRGTASSVQLYHNNNQSYILNHADSLIVPLQQKGIKVLLGLLGDHTGVGFANLTPAMINSFAQQIADCVTTYNLDGVDFDDEYAEYGKIAGLPSQSSAIFGNLITKVRQLLPGKLITAFRYNNANGFNQTALNALSYMWPDFGTDYNAPTGFANSKWARMSIHFTNYFPLKSAVESCADSYSGYGAIMMFNLRDYDCSAKMNWFAPRVWGGRTVSYTGTSHPKNY